MNWESVLLGAIPGFLALAAVIYGKMQDRKAKREELDQTNQARKEPTWNELVTENRNLRRDLGSVEERFNTKIEALERKMDRKVNALENVIRDTAAQWPKEYDPPVFNSEDLTELLDNNIPWKHRVRIVPGLA